MKNTMLLTVKNKLPSMFFKTTIWVLVAVVFFAAGMVFSRNAVPCGSQRHSADEHADGCEAETECGEHSEHIHSYGDLHSEEKLGTLETIRCEHKIPIVDCDNCRFEVGVVKIDKSIESLIETGLVQDIDRTKTLTLTGQVQLDRTKAVDVVSTGGGRVEQVKKLLGEKVVKGDILAVIHSADLGQAKADFLEVQAKLELTQATFKREEGLYEKKITSQAEYQNALNELKMTRASFAAADKKLRLFGLGTEEIAGIRNKDENEAFADLVLRAPQSGTIITQNISIGKMADTAESLYTIADLSNLWVWCDVYERDLAILHEQFSQDKSLLATVRVKAFESIAFNGAVDFVGNVMDEHTRTVKMRVQVKNPHDKLRPGMFADVDIAVPLPGRMAAVPQVAVMSDAGKNFVFQHWKNDLWVRRDVAIGDKYGNFVEILSGIPKAATIVTGGAFMLKSDILREKMGAGCAD